MMKNLPIHAETVLRVITHFDTAIFSMCHLQLWLHHLENANNTFVYGEIIHVCVWRTTM